MTKWKFESGLNKKEKAAVIAFALIAAIYDFLHVMRYMIQFTNTYTG